MHSTAHPHFWLLLPSRHHQAAARPPFSGELSALKHLPLPPLLLSTHGRKESRSGLSVLDHTPTPTSFFYPRPSSFEAALRLCRSHTQGRPRPRRCSPRLLAPTAPRAVQQASPSPPMIPSPIAATCSQDLFHLPAKCEVNTVDVPIPRQNMVRARVPTCLLTRYC